MPRFKHGAFLYNGTAGRETAEQIISQAAPILALHCQQLTIIQTTSDMEFRQACMDSSFYADVLFIIGGDGTLHSAIQVFDSVENLPVIGLLPGGTCNDFARTLEIPLNLMQAAEEIVAGEVREIDLVQINEHVFMNFAGIGLVAEVSENIDPILKEKYGKLSYFLSALHTFNKSDSFSVVLEIDGTTFYEQATLILVMNGKYMGTHRIPIDEIDPSDGLLNIILIKESNMLAIREWISLTRNEMETMDLTNVTHYSCQNLVIRTEVSKNVDTDGEIYIQTPVKIGIKPKAIRFLCPSKRK